jgi:hypothetical protein
MFDCVDLTRGKHWDGHTEADAETRLMSLEPECNKGEWIDISTGKGIFKDRSVKCSKCGNTLDLDGVNCGRGDANFCPNCGADMRPEPYKGE